VLDALDELVGPSRLALV